MKTAKEIAITGLFVALLIGGQLLFSTVAGVEIVTVLLLCFSYAFGAVRGTVCATAFSLLRCFVFGVFPSVLILYFVYYNLFALFFGLWGTWNKRKISVLRTVLTVAFALVFTTLFTLLDDVITPLYYGYTAEATKAYFVSSLPVMVPQLICTALTVSFLFVPIEKALERVKR